LDSVIPSLKLYLKYVPVLHSLGPILYGHKCSFHNQRQRYFGIFGDALYILTQISSRFQFRSAFLSGDCQGIFAPLLESLIFVYNFQQIRWRWRERTANGNVRKCYTIYW